MKCDNIKLCKINILVSTFRTFDNRDKALDNRDKADALNVLIY